MMTPDERKMHSAEFARAEDIPEAPAEAWKHARRPDFYWPLKKTVTLRVDMDVLAWFKDHTERGYQTEMNRVLRKYMLDIANHDQVA